MAGCAHLAGLTRWPGMPTSGRYVFRRDDGTWYWQCDLCGDSQFNSSPTMRDAFTLAVIHAGDCVGYYAEDAS